MIINAIQTSINRTYQIQNNKNCYTRYNNIIFQGKNKNNSLNSKLVFNKAIQGFNIEKERFFNDFLEPIASNNIYSETVPSVALSATDKYVLDMFKKAILSYSYMNKINLVEIPANTNPQDLVKLISAQLKKNAEYFAKNQRRSIIILNNPENFIGLDSSEVENFSPLKLSKKDVKLISQNNNFSNINYFKSILDFCNKLPIFTNNGCATTFIFSTQKPQLIHPDMRDGKMEKFHIDFPKADDIEEIIKTHLIKNYSNQIKHNDIDTLSQLLAQYFEINSIQQGGYSIGTVLGIINKALKNTKNFEIKNLAMSLIKTTKETSIDVSKKQINYYKRIKNLISKTIDEYEMFKALEDDGMLDENDEILFKKLIQNEIALMKKLLEKKKNKTISLVEKETLRKLLKRYH